MEIWKPIPSLDYHEASSHGRIRNSKTGRVRKLRMNKKGYMVVNIARPAILRPTAGAYKSANMIVSRLVAEAFLEDYSQGLEVDHINRVRSDNRPENLRMASRISNAANKGIKLHEVALIVEQALLGFTAEEIFESLSS